MLKVIFKGCLCLFFLLCCGFAYISWPYYCVGTFQRNCFNKVEVGMTRAEVLEICGEPHSSCFIPDLYDWRYFLYEKDSKEFKELNNIEKAKKLPKVNNEEFWWGWQTFFLPISLIILFDEDGKVIAKRRID